MVRSRGAAKVRRELLVGFDPLAQYCAALQTRFGHLAALFWDGFGGRAVAVKWRPDALLPVRLQDRPAPPHPPKNVVNVVFSFTDAKALASALAATL